MLRTLSSKNVLEWPDYAVIIGSLLFCTYLGFHFRQTKNPKATRRNGSSEDTNNGGSGHLEEFLLASRNLSFVPVAVSITATSLSAVSLTGVTGELYEYGVQFSFEYVGIFIGSLCASFFIVPMYRSSNFVSVFQLMETRFDRSMRKIFSIAYIVQKLLFLTLVIYLPALSIMTLTNFDYRITTLVLGTICTLYCTIGGLRAVIWTDVFQALLMFTTLILVTVKCYMSIGQGSDTNIFSEVSTSAIEGGYLTSIWLREGSDVRYSIWSALVMGFFWGLDLFLVNQALVQRILGSRSTSDARWSVVAGGTLSLLFGVIVTCTGAVLYTYYGQCDPLTLSEYTQVMRTDQIFVYAVGDLLNGYPGLKGLAIAGIISASLSTFSSFINSFASVTLEDFVKPWFPEQTKNERTCLFICMVLSSVFGFLAILGSFLVPTLGNAVQALGILNGILGGPLLGAAFLALFWKQTTKKGCLFGLCLGLAFNTWITVFNKLCDTHRDFPKLKRSISNCDNFYPFFNSSFQNELLPNTLSDELGYCPEVLMPLYQISFTWYPATGFLVASLTGIIICFFLGSVQSRGVNKELVEPTLVNLKQPQEKIELLQAFECRV